MLNVKYLSINVHPIMHNSGLSFISTLNLVKTKTKIDENRIILENLRIIEWLIKFPIGILILIRNNISNTTSNRLSSNLFSIYIKKGISKIRE